MSRTLRKVPLPHVKHTNTSASILGMWSGKSISRDNIHAQFLISREKRLAPKVCKP